MITVIIATRDRAAILSATLDALSRQDTPGCGVEILVVDNASMDRTPAVVAAAAERSAVPIVYLHEARPGKSHALNTAVTHARGDLLVLTDDDVLPSRGWLAAHARAFGETGADFAAGRILPLWEAPPPRWLSPDLYGVLAIPDGGTRRLPISRGLNEAIMPLGANMAVRRAVLDRIGGWDPNLGKLQGSLRTGEDHEFSLKLIAAGCTGVYEPEAWVKHRVPAGRLRFGYFQRWFFDNGAIEARLEEDYPTTTRYIAGVPRYLWRHFGGNLVATLGGVVSGRLDRAIASELKLAWFAGYLKGRLAVRKHVRVDPQAAAVPRELKP
jgi:glycosyltransferase involved in cell wall biosynthesis